MNNGQPSRIPDQSDFSMPSPGEQFDAKNNGPENNLDLSNPAVSWNLPKPEAGDSPETGSIHSSEQNAANSKSEVAKEKPHQLGQIEEMSMMPPAIGEEEKLNPALVAKNSLDHTALKTTDLLSPEGVKVVDDIIDKFKSSGEDAATFYDAARAAMEDNLDNSYGRKLQS